MILVLVLLCSGTGAAASFGAFSYDRYQETEQRSAEFRIGLLNLGDQDLTIELSAGTGNSTTVSFEQERFVLPPSEQSTDPGPGWVHLDGDRYARPTVIRPTITIRTTATARNHTVPVTVRAIQTAGEGTEQVQQRVLQESVHQLTLYSSSGRIGQEDDGTDRFTVDGGTEGENSTPASREQNGTNGILSILPQQDAQNDLTGPEQSGSRDTADGWTTTSSVLLAGILVVGGYIAVNLL